MILGTAQVLLSNPDYLKFEGFGVKGYRFRARYGGFRVYL